MHIEALKYTSTRLGLHELGSAVSNALDVNTNIFDLLYI